MTGSSSFAATARARADRILSERRFKAAPGLPHPFRGVLHWLGGVFSSIGHLLRHLARTLPGGPFSFWTVIALLVIAVAALVGARLTQGGAAEVERGGTVDKLGSPEPGRLESEAVAAEASGEYERAVRLLFLAGLLRLDRAEAIEYRASLTTGEVARELRLSEFDRLGARFDEIAYGGEPALKEDVADSRRGWRLVVQEARSA